jgi:hypothetical protein
MVKNLAGGQFGNLLGGGGGGGDQGGKIPSPTSMLEGTIGGVMDAVPKIAAAGFNAMLK